MKIVSFHTLTIRHRDCDYEISCFVRPGKQETIAYLHGLGSTKYDFFGAVNQERFNDFTLVAFDLPGCGNSSYFDQVTLEIDDLVEITHKTFSSLGLDGLSLIGHSMGGMIALLYARNYPEEVKRFVNVEGNLAPEDCGVLSRRTAQLTWQEFVEQDFMKTLQAEFASLPYTGARVFADTFRKAVADQAFHSYCVSIVEHSDSGKLMPIFKQLRLPRLFIYGEANKHLSYISELGNSGITVVEVPGSHHWPHRDSPEFYFKAIHEFIKGSGFRGSNL
ncbi:MAG: alpha/beta hydrolase [Blastocatellia bacterium]|nr:alpha/beta hydrolase [Blastocatellia bacterium]